MCLFLLTLAGAGSWQMFNSCKSVPKPYRELTGLDSLIQQKMQEGRLIGIGAAIIVNKKVIWMKGYGYADRNAGIPFTPLTMINAGSIAKTFTGVCMMKAVEENLISLDEDINSYLPFKVQNPNCPEEKITLRQIATHSSSLLDRYPFYTDSLYFTGKDSPDSLGNFLKAYFVPGGKHYTKENFSVSKPGTYWDYSNIAAALAGYIIELQTGMKLNEYSRRHIQKPLKMKNTGWFFNEFDLARHARLYNTASDTVKEIPLYGCTTYPDGGVRTSVNDLSRFFICLLNGGSYQNCRILKESSVAEMTRLQFSNTHKPENIDLTQKNEGLFWRTKNSGKLIGHGGSDPGIKTEMLADPDKNAAIILFTNTDLTERYQLKAYFDILNQLMEQARKMKATSK